MPTDIDSFLGKRLRRRRRLLGLTQQQLATKVGILFQQIQKYECGANRISAARIWQLAEALESPVTYFYDGLKEFLEGREVEEAVEEHPRSETLDLIEAYYALEKAPRRRLLDLARAMRTEHGLEAA